jgi:hypothetical protein
MRRISPTVFNFYFLVIRSCRRGWGGEGGGGGDTAWRPITRDNTTWETPRTFFGDTCQLIKLPVEHRGLHLSSMMSPNVCFT